MLTGERVGALRNAAKNKLTPQLLAPTAAKGGVIAQLDPVPHTHTSRQQGWGTGAAGGEEGGGV